MDKLVEEFKKLDTTCISDACDKLGITCGLYGIKPITPGSVMCGRAFTVHYVPCGQVKGTVGDFLDDVQEGQIIVIDNGGREYCTVWGDIMSIFATKKGIGGTLIDGVCRDLTVLKKTGYPLFSKGYYMVTGKDRVYVDKVNEIVSVSGVQVSPGDMILADDTGAVSVPYDRAEEVLAVAKNIDEVEKQILSYLEEGLSLKEARTKTGYHSLQSKPIAK